MVEIIAVIISLVGTCIGWLIVNHVSTVQNSITEVKGHVGKVSEDLNELAKTVVKIETSLDHLKDSGKIFNNNPQVTILRNPKGKFE